MKTKALLVLLVAVMTAGAAVIGYLSARSRNSGPLELADRMELPLRLEGRPAPPLDFRIDEDEILRIFPVETSGFERPVVPVPTPGTKRSRTDEDVLGEVTSRWVYVSYANLAGVPIGGFRYNDRPGMREGFEVRQGERHEGVTVFYLDNAKAMARYGKSTIRLPRIDTLEIHPSDRPLAYASAEFIPDSTLAWKRYWELWGKRFKIQSKNYVPAPGEHMPPTEPLSREEMKQRVDRYIDFVNRQMQFRNNQESDGKQFSPEEIRQKIYEKYRIQEEPPPAESPEESPGTIRVGE